MTKSSETTMEAKADLVMSLAKKLGADQSSVTVQWSRGVETAMKNDNLDLAKVASKRSLRVKLYVDGRLGSFTTGDLREQALKDFVARGMDMTRALAPDPYNKLPDPERYPTGPGPDLNIYDPAVESSEPQAAVERSRNLVAHVRDIAEAEKLKLVSTEAFVGMDAAYELMTASNGLAVTSKRTGCYAYALVSLQDGSDKDKRRSDWWGVSYTALSDLGNSDSDRSTAKKAVERCMRKLGAVKGPSGAMPVVIENSAAFKLVKGLIAAINGRALYQKSSFLAGMIDKPVAASVLDLRDEPLLKGALGSSRYDGEGAQRSPMPIIEGGILRNYYLDTYYSGALSLKPTVSSSSNLVLRSTTDAGCAELLAGIDKGMLITGFLGGNINSTTGQFSHGVSGLWIEHGKTTRPVEGMNVSGDHKEIWKDLAQVGNDPYIYSQNRMPSLMFSKLILSGID